MITTFINKLERRLSSINKEKEHIGVWVGILISICIVLSTPSIGVGTMISDKRITPEWKLRTNGKIVDTLYIYKNE